MIKKTLLLVVVFSLLHLTAYASEKIYFPHIDCRGEWGTELCVINTSECGQLKGVFRPFNDEGKAVSETLQITLEPRGRRQLSVGSDFTNPDSIGYVVFEAESSNLTGYVKFYINGKYRVAVPAIKEINTGDIYVPHIASDASKWWTGLSLVNTNGFSVTLTITFDIGEICEITLEAGEHRAFTVAQLFGGNPRPDINSAVITNASGIVGLELFGSAGDGNQLSGILLKDDKTQTIYYPHVASDAIWWTGIVVYNTADVVNHITITPYTEDGTELPKKEFEIPPNGKYIGTVAQLALHTGTAWFKVEGDSPITGFELFGDQNKNQMAGYTGVGISARDGVFGKIDKEGWTGIALVNIEDSEASVNLVAYNDAGTVVATKVISVESCAKVVDLAENLFTQDINGATYIAYASDKEIVGFQLNGSSDGMMLDGLPAQRNNPTDYENLLIECYYISQCSMSEANDTVSTSISHDKPGYGAVNEWRIGNGRADSVNPGTSAIGMVGLLYGYNRINGNVTEVSGITFDDVSWKVKQALSSFFWNWITNTENQIKDGDNIGFPNKVDEKIIYDTNGNRIDKPKEPIEANAGTTAEILIAMNKYRQLSPNNDRDKYQSEMYSTALYMAQYIDSQINNTSWTIDRAYMVAAFHAFGNWATAVGATDKASKYHGKAIDISGWLADHQDKTLCNYYSYLDSGGNGVYDGGNIDQTGFSPYEFNAFDPGEGFAAQVASFWETGSYEGTYLTVQSGPYIGGVHQIIPKYPTRVYPGDSFQLADAVWKIGKANGNQYWFAKAWSHYNFALSPIGSIEGSGCWVNDISFDSDGFIGGFIDWVDEKNGSRPPNSYERFVDTSAYMIIATEELVFDSAVTWTD